MALEIADRFQARLTIVTVVPTGTDPQEAYLQGLVPRDVETKALHHQVDELQEEAKGRGIPSVEVVTLEGKVVETFLAYLQSHPHDLVVVGSRGLSRGSRLLLGSVSGGLVNGAPCPILVVRSTGRARS
jgi:nucleotide-binding universal stress UspA family protein